ILGDFTVGQTLKMLRCMRAAERLMDTALSLTLKPHPVSPIQQDACPGLAFDVTDKPLADLVRDFDVAFASNTTSASLDAFLSGLPVVVFLDDQDFNYNPLRDVA